MIKSLRQNPFYCLVLSVLVHASLFSGMLVFEREINDHITGSKKEQRQVVALKLEQKREIKKQIPRTQKMSSRRFPVRKKVMPTKAINKIKRIAKNAKAAGNTNNKVVSEYAAALKAYIDKNKFYPRMAARLGHSGIVKIKVSIAADGRFTNVEIINPSSFDSLNSSSINLLKKLAKFKPLPENLAAGENFIIPIVYKMARR